MPQSSMPQKQGPAKLMAPAERSRVALKAGRQPQAIAPGPAEDERQPGDDIAPVDYESQDG